MPGGKGRRIIVEFIGEDRSLSATASKVEGKTGSLLGKFGKVSAVAGAAGLSFGAVAAGMYKAGEAASDLSETQSKVAQIFGNDSAKALDKWAKGAAASMGQSRQQALDAAATFATFGKSAGLSGKSLRDFSTDNAKLASDLASFHNTSPEEAIDAIGAALRGEAEPMRRYGVLLDDASMRQEAVRQGLIKTTKEALTPQQKVLAAQALIYKQTKDAQGDFARTSDGLANKQRILKARFENVKVAVGKAVVPALLAATDGALRLLKAAEPVGRYLQSKLGPVFVFVGGLLKKFGKDGQDSSGKFGKMLDSIRSILGSVQSVVVSFVGFAKAIWRNYGDTIMSIAKTAFGGLLNIIGGILRVISGVWKTFASLLKGDWSGVWDGIKMILSGAWQAIKGILQVGWAVVHAIFVAAGAILKAIFKGIWNGLKALATAAWNALTGIVKAGWNGIKAAFIAAGQAVRTVFSSIWAGLRQRALDGIEAIRSAIAKLPGKIRALGGLMRSAGRWILEKLLDGIAVSGSVASNFAEKLWDAIKSVINNGVDRLNRFLEFDYTIPVVNKTVRFDPPDIPHLYKGGVVKGSKFGTPIVAGDRGHDEAVIPLSGPNAPDLGGGDINITLTLDGEVVHRVLVKRKQIIGRNLGLA